MATIHDYDTMFREVYPRLVSLGTLKCGRLDVARELAQETMLRAHSRWDELAEYDAPAAWCHTVMVNLLIDHHRRAVSERRAVELVTRDAEPVQSEPSETSALDRWNQIVAPLPERQRLIVTLHYADDLSVSQIAQLVGTTRGAVKASLFKARRSLRSSPEVRAAHTRGGDDG